MERGDEQEEGGWDDGNYYDFWTKYQNNEKGEYNPTPDYPPPPTDFTVEIVMEDIPFQWFTHIRGRTKGLGWHPEDLIWTDGGRERIVNGRQEGNNTVLRVSWDKLGFVEDGLWEESTKWLCWYR